MGDASISASLTRGSLGSIENRGILGGHAKIVGEYNKENNWLIVFRPINSDVAKKLNEGYRGKVIFIKSKSSEFPPIGGDIPFEAELSKSFDKGKDTIEHFNGVAKDAIKSSKDNIAKKKEKVEKYKKDLEDKKRELKTKEQELETKEQELETKEQELETKKQELEKLQVLEASLPSSQQQLEADKIELENRKQVLMSSQQQLEADKIKLENGKQVLMSSQQQLEAEIKKDEEKVKYAIEEYNLNFFLSTKQKTVKIPQENGEFELYYRKTAENGHNVEIESIGKDEYGNDVFRPVFYAKNAGKCYRLLYNDDGTIKKQEEVEQQHINDNLKPVEIFTYSQYSLDTGELEQPPLTADYDQLTAGPVYMTINTDQTDKKKKKLWEAIDYITSLQNSEFNQENLEWIKSHLKNIQIFLPVIEQGKKDNYNCIRNVDSLTIEQIKPNEIKEQLEYLKDNFLTHVRDINLDGIDLEFCRSKREKLITYPADRYMKRLKKDIEENILNIENTQQFKENWAIIEGNLWEIQEFLPEQLKNKYLYFKEETLGPDLIDMGEIKTQVRIVGKKLGLLGTCSEAITKEKMEIGKRLDYGISHGLEIQHFPPEPIKPRGEEFLIIDERGKVRVIDGLEGLLSHINYKKSRGTVFLEVNPLWPIKRLDDGSIIVCPEEEQTPIASIYSSLVDLQTLTKKERPLQKDFDPLGYYIYAERLYYNGDFIPCAYELKQKDVKKFEKLKSEVTIDALTEANTAYQKSSEQLEIMLNSLYLEEDKFLDFCCKEPIKGSASYLENHEDVVNLFKDDTKKEKIMNFLLKLTGVKDLKKDYFLDLMYKATNIDCRSDSGDKYFEFFKKFIETDSPLEEKQLRKLFKVIPNLNLLKGLEEGRQFKTKILKTKEFIEGRMEQIQRLLRKKSQSLPVQKLKSQYYWRNKIKRSKSTPNLSKTGYILD